MSNVPPCKHIGTIYFLSQLKNTLLKDICLIFVDFQFKIKISLLKKQTYFILLNNVLTFLVVSAANFSKVVPRTCAAFCATSSVYPG